jgi:hypothetical protein
MHAHTHHADTYSGLFLSLPAAPSLPFPFVSRFLSRRPPTPSFPTPSPFPLIPFSQVTGDALVPAGSLSFRAKVGRQHRLDVRDVYPDELGIVAR